MAIDTSIPLSGKPVEMPDMMSLAKNFQSIRNSQLEAQTREAQLPGVQAQSRSAEAQAKQDEIKAQAAQFVRDEAKNPAHRNKDGYLDPEKLAQATEMAGFPDMAAILRKNKAEVTRMGADAEIEETKAKLAQREPAFLEEYKKQSLIHTKPGPDGKPVVDERAVAFAMMGDFPAETSRLFQQQLANQTTDIQNSTNEQERQAKVVAHSKDVAGVVAQGLQHIRDPQLRQNFVNARAKALYAIDPSAAETIFGKPDANGNYEVKPADAYIAHALTPQEAQALKVSQAGVTSTYAGVEQVRQQIKAFNEGTLSPSERADLLIKKANATTDITLFGKATAALDKIIGAGASPGALARPFSAVISTVSDNAERAVLLNVQKKMLERGIDISNMKIGDRALRAAIENEMEVSKGLKTEFENLGKNPGEKNKVTPTETKPAESAKPGEGTNKNTVKMKSPKDGKYYRIPVNEVEDAKNNGWTL